MIRNSRILGLALVAVLALTAIAASSASAKFDSEAENMTLHGEQSTTHKFTVTAGSVTCEKATFAGTQTGTLVAPGIYTAADVSITPTYEKCVGLGTTHIDMNGCTYTLTPGASKVGSVHIVCPPSTSIRVTGTGFASLCTVSVPPQTPTINQVTYVNKGTESSREVEVKAEIGGIHYTQHGVFCPGNSFATEKSFTNGTYTGNTIVKGSSGGVQKGIWVTD